MKLWEQFLPDVLVHVPGCPDPAAEHAIKRAAQEFFEATRVWKMWLPEVVTDAGATDYPMFLEPKTDLVRLERATLNGRPIRVRTEDELPQDWKTYTAGIEDGVHTSDRGTLILLPPKETGMVLLVEASMKPSETATGIAEHFFSHYVSQIACGAIAALKEHEDQPYTDKTGAPAWRSRFERHMNVVDFQRFRGYSSTRPRRPIKTF